MIFGSGQPGSEQSPFTIVNACFSVHLWKIWAGTESYSCIVEIGVHCQCECLLFCCYWLLESNNRSNITDTDKEGERGTTHADCRCFWRRVFTWSSNIEAKVLRLMIYRNLLLFPLSMNACHPTACKAEAGRLSNCLFGNQQKKIILTGNGWLW